MYIKHKINNIQTMKFIKSPRQDYTTYFLFFTLFFQKTKKGAVKKVPKKKGCDLAKKQDSSLFLWYN